MKTNLCIVFLALALAVSAAGAAGGQVVRGPVDTFTDEPVNDDPGRAFPETADFDDPGTIDPFRGPVAGDTSRSLAPRQPDIDDADRTRSAPDQSRQVRRPALGFETPGAPEPARQNGAAGPPAEDFQQYDLAEDEAEMRRIDGLDTSDTRQADLAVDDPVVDLRGVADDDPYAPLGIRTGSFLLFPSIETRLEHSNNVGGRSIDPESGTAYEITPSLDIVSDWSRHALTLRGQLTYEGFDSDLEQDTTEFAFSSDLRLDVTDLTTLDFGADFEREREDRSEIDVPDGVARLTDADTITLTGAITRQFGRWFASISGDYTRETFEDTELVDGSLVDNTERDRDEQEIQLRVGRAIDDQWQVFGDVFINQRTFDQEIDDNGFRRGSDGWGIAAGAIVDRGGPIRGEIRLGYQEQTPEDARFATIRGLIADALIEWRPSGLTTVTFSAETEFEETVTANASGVRTHILGLGVEHALRRYLIISGGLFYEIDEVEGLDTNSTELTAEAEIEYTLRRGLSVFADIGYTQFNGAQAGSDYDETVIGIGARLRR